MNQVRIPAQRGFGLIEVLVTVLVLAVALMSLSKFQGDSLKEGSLAKQRTEATNIAQSQIESLRNYTNYANVTTPTNNPTSVVGDNATYSVNTLVTAVDTNLKQVSVTVTWQDSKGVSNTVTLASAISNTSPDATAAAAATP